MILFGNASRIAADFVLLHLPPFVPFSEHLNRKGKIILARKSKSGWKAIEISWMEKDRTHIRACQTSTGNNSMKNCFCVLFSGQGIRNVTKILTVHSLFWINDFIKLSVTIIYCESYVWIRDGKEINFILQEYITYS